MIKLLQRQFIAVAMGSLLVVLILVLGGMNLLYHYQVEQKTEGFLWLIASYAGEFPEEQSASQFLNPIHRQEKSGAEQAEKQSEADANDERIPLEDSRYEAYQALWPLRQLLNAEPLISAETRFSTRYFTVFADNSGVITQMNLNHIAISEEVACQYGEEVLESEREEGYLEQYRYLQLVNGSGNMIIFLDCTTQLEMVQSFLYLSCGIAFFVFVVVFLLVVIFSRSAIAPIVTSMEKQKQFITDAGHELKTPLAIIAANTDVLTLYGGKNQWTESIRKQTERLNLLVQEMLMLARMEEQKQEFMELDFSALVEQTAAPLAVLAEQKQADFCLQLEAHLLLQGDGSSLQKMVSVLVENAVKYVQPSGQVTVTLKKKGRSAQLAVYNSCDIVPDGDLNLLFDRFRRTDASRARESGGYGIGLSVARAVAQKHRGKIYAQRQKQGLCFTVRLPLA